MSTAAASSTSIPVTWRGLPASQQPEWPDRGRLNAVTSELARLPPLVFAGECELLRERLAAVTRGEAFVLQGGDCAETFDGATADAIHAKLQTLLQMALVLTYGASVPIVKIARMAGQFAKPRSRPTEAREGVELPAYRGDAVNGFEFTRQARTPDPDRLGDLLPPLIRAVSRAGTPVAWVCDPMHGNTFEAPTGHKTRRFHDVLEEVRGFFDVHRALGTHPGGIHIEFTGDNVTECVGGSHAIAEDDLHQRYETACDPRLNRSQSLDLAFMVAESYRHPPGGAGGCTAGYQRRAKVSCPYPR